MAVGTSYRVSDRPRAKIYFGQSLLRLHDRFRCEFGANSCTRLVLQQAFDGLNCGAPSLFGVVAELIQFIERVLHDAFALQVLFEDCDVTAELVDAALLCGGNPLSDFFQIDCRLRWFAGSAWFLRRIEVSQIINRHANRSIFVPGSWRSTSFSLTRVMLKTVPELPMLTLSPRVASLALACSTVVLFGFSVRASANCSSTLTVDCVGAFFRGCFVFLVAMIYSPRCGV
jgi:hypothetical protein